MYVSLENFNAFLYTYIVTPLFLLNGCSNNNSSSDSDTETSSLNDSQKSSIEITEENKEHSDIIKFFDDSNNEYTLKNKCFYQDTVLEIFSIDISNTVVIGKEAFYECRNLTSVTLGNSVTTIGNQAFQSCTGLTSVTIPDSVTTIGERAFFNCTDLSSVTLPTNSDFKTIGERAFQGCNSLSSITIPNSVTSIGNKAFEYCRSLISITIPDFVTTIGPNAFTLCTDLSSVTLGNSVETIGKEAFYMCTGLTSITIPNSVTKIGENSFKLSGITNMYVTQYTYNTKFKLKDLKEDASGNVMFRGKHMKIHILPNTSTSSSTKNYSGLLKNVSQYNITTDQDDIITFSNGGPLTYTDVSNSEMKTDPNITKVVIQDHTSIGSEAFLDCSNIETIQLPSSVKDISTNAFNGCTNLQKILVNDKNEYYTSDTYDILYKYIPLKGTKELIKVPASLRNLSDSQDLESSYTIDTYTIDTYTTKIAEYAFYDCSNIQTVTIPPLVRTIGKHAFETKGNRLTINMSDFTLYYLHKYYSYKDSNNVYDISFNPSFNPSSSIETTTYTPSTFFGYKDNILNDNILSFDIILNTDFLINNNSNNTTLEKYTATNENITNVIVSNYKTISEGCFINKDKDNNNNIQILSLENGTDNSLNTIGPSAFADCSNLTFILYEEQEQLQKYNNNNNITIQSVYNTINDLSGNQDASGVFENCSKLLSFSVPLYVPTIPHYAFKNCISLLDINMSPNTKKIDEEAFENCSSLTFLDLKDVTTSSNNIIKNTLFLTSINVPNNLDNFELTDLYTLITNNNNSVTSNNIKTFKITLDSLTKLNKKVSESG